MAQTPKTPNDELDKFLLRMPDGLRKRIKREAEKNNRSMNSEIVATLEEAYPARAFDLAQFMEEWMFPIIQAPVSDRLSLIEKANEYLRSERSEMTVSTEQKPNGKMDVILTMGGARLLVGESAAELIVL
ncbi:Arc family DNA-binding protein [Rhizobium aouanii]|uniref:Arc family DNA-binding protein n=1 Tax=Rhizobium aouanii TaxID=3118145 RepID=A0ABU8CKR7_9HYPH